MNQHVLRASEATATSLSGMRVMLVEDAWIIAQSYAALLEPLGMTIVGPAARLADAQKLLADNPVHAALVDMNLQGEYAYELIDALLERNIPTIIVTGYEVLPRIEGRVTALLKKPIRAEHLLRALRSVAATGKDLQRTAAPAS